MLDTFRTHDPNTVLRPSLGICRRRRCNHRVPSIFHHPMAEYRWHSMHDTYNHHPSNLVCNYTNRIHSYPYRDHRTTDPGHVRTRNCRIHNICPKSLPPDCFACRTRTHHTHIVLCHCNRPALCCPGDILNYVLIRCAHQCCRKRKNKLNKPRHF